MQRDTRADLSPPPGQVEFALAQIEQSAPFRNSPRHRALLRHLVTRWLADDTASLKETLIGVEVFGRPAASFDPKLDSIVRVEARRLRTRLNCYHAGPGRSSPLRIELPVGSYVPLVTSRDPAEPPPESTRRGRDLVERGEHFLRQALSRETLEQALARFDEALRETPLHVRALVGAARAWLNLATGWYHEPAIASAHAAEALRRAIALEPGQPVAHALLGAIQHQFEHDWPGAERHFQRALALAPSEAFVHSAYGCHLLMHGAFDAAERELGQARTLDPQYINARQHMVNLRIGQRRFADAEAEILAMQDIAPETMAIVGARGTIAMLRGDAATAEACYRRACAVMPDYAGCFVALAGAIALGGRGAEGDALLADTLCRFEGRPVSPYVRAVYATHRGDPDAAFALLGRALLERDPQAMQTPFDPSFDALHADARWAALVGAPPFRGVR